MWTNFEQSPVRHGPVGPVTLGDGATLRLITAYERAIFQKQQDQQVQRVQLLGTGGAPSIGCLCDARMRRALYLRFPVLDQRPSADYVD